MNEELVKAATENREALDAFYALRNAERGVQAAIVRYIQGELKLMANKLAFDFKGSDNCDYSAKWSGFEFTNAELKTIPLQIRFEFDKSGYRDFCFGFVDNAKLPAESRELLKTMFAEVYGKPASSPTWPAYVDWSRYQNWSTIFPDIRFGKFVEDVEKEVVKLNMIAMQFREKQLS
jgi:hypothetical protein